MEIKKSPNKQMIRSQFTSKFSAWELRKPRQIQFLSTRFSLCKSRYLESDKERSSNSKKKKIVRGKINDVCWIKRMPGRRVKFGHFEKSLNFGKKTLKSNFFNFNFFKLGCFGQFSVFYLGLKTFRELWVGLYHNLFDLDVILV